MTGAVLQGTSWQKQFFRALHDRRRGGCNESMDQRRQRWRKKKLEIAAKLEKPGFEVHVGETGSNVRYKDYFNVTDQKVQLQQY